MTLRLGVVLPTYNERKNLRSMVDRLDQALAGITWEVIVVDDNSPDGTADEARALAQEDPRVHVIQRIGRRGLSSAAIEGMCATAAPIVAVMDADHQHDPALLPQMLAAIESGDYDLAYGSRFAEGASTEEWGRPDRVKASNFANRIANKVTGVELTDPLSGYFMLRSATLRADAAAQKHVNAHLRAAGILKGESKYYISLAHTEADVRHTLDAFEAALATLPGRRG